jgi:hypothetical protein
MVVATIFAVLVVKHVIDFLVPRFASQLSWEAGYVFVVSVGVGMPWLVLWASIRQRRRLDRENKRQSE